MRKVGVTYVVALAALLGAPGVAAAQVALQDSAVGSGAAGDPPFGFSFRFAATSGPGGENPSGTANATDGFEFAFGGSVTCLEVTGNSAVIGVENEFLADFPVAGTIISVVDGGPAGSQLDTIDLFFFLNTVPTPDTCVPPTGIPPTPSPVFSGDINVQDARARPTSTHQCKHDGWRTFGVFKNQGDCVSFVRHQARQECIFIRAAHGQPAFRAWYGGGVHKRHAMRRCVRQRSGD
jgi:hypothetical protein